MFIPLRDHNPIKHIRFAYVNYSLLAVTCIAFALTALLPENLVQDLQISYGLVPGVMTGIYAQPLYFIPKEVALASYAFLHIDWMHLLSNMLFLWIFGDNIEDALGHLRYFIFYLACAVLAGIAHILADPGSAVPMIGASGAVAGVMGAYVLLFPHARLLILARIVIPIPLPVPAFWMLGFWIVSQLFFAFAGTDQSIAWWAHIGGVFAGAFLAYFMRRRGFPILGGR